MWNSKGPKTLSPIVRSVKPAAEVQSRGVSYELTLHGGAFAALLKEMQRRSTLSTRALSKKLGVEPNSINQYFYKKRGMGGSSTMKWFLRFAEACGCRLYLTFPTERELRRLEQRPMMPPAIEAVEVEHAATHDH
jgi:hypothetical protein